jgi:hypothetical protein
MLNTASEAIDGCRMGLIRSSRPEAGRNADSLDPRDGKPNPDEVSRGDQLPASHASPDQVVAAVYARQAAIAHNRRRKTAFRAQTPSAQSLTPKPHVRSTGISKTEAQKTTRC